MQPFSLTRALEILERTPIVLETWLSCLSDDWTTCNEGPETWSAYDVMGHLIHGENTDWIARMEIILSDGGNKTFASFDRFAQFQESKGKTLQDLLLEFKTVRNTNLTILRSKKITEEMLDRTAMHPALGEVTLRNLLSTWVAHDLGHLAQIARVMAKQYKEEIGPWVVYMRVVNQ